MRIALINNLDHGGGAERVVRSLREGLRTRGHDVTLWVGRRRTQDDRVGTQVLGRTEAERLAAHRYARKGFYGLGIRSSDRFVESNALAGHDVVHLHNVHGHYLSLTAIVRLAQRFPLIWTFHDFFPITGGCAFPCECDRWMTTCGHCPQAGRYPVGPFADRTRRLLGVKRELFGDLPVTIVVPSQHLADAVQRSRMFKAVETHVIPYGVDTDVFAPRRDRAREDLGLSDRERVVLLVAPRLHDPRKGIEYAVAALRRLDLDDLTVLVVGSGDSQPIADRLGRDRVKMMGYIKDGAMLAACYAAADLFLFTSLAENFPCAVQEAMASGTPVLGFDIEGVNEQVVSGKTGLLVSLRDPIALKDAARRLLTDGSLRRNLGVAARKKAYTRWSLDWFVSRHEELYARLVG
ncbi:MAG: glycosyltransferase [Phycisphaerae bacterium]|jgi:glycosyltransferase involved in cell wall biosynthesis